MLKILDETCHLLYDDSGVFSVLKSAKLSSGMGGSFKPDCMAGLDRITQMGERHEFDDK